MAGITLAQAEAKLTAALAALEKAMSVQAYSIAGRSKTNANLEALQRSVDYWDNKVKELSGGRTGIAVRGVTPC